MSSANNETSEASKDRTLDFDYFRKTLTDALNVLKEREAAIRRDVRRGLNSDSKEREVELENSEVLNALSDDAFIQIEAIQQALERMDAGRYGICAKCEEPIHEMRLRAYPQTVWCTSCASDVMR